MAVGLGQPEDEGPASWARDGAHVSLNATGAAVIIAAPNIPQPKGVVPMSSVEAVSLSQTIPVTPEGHRRLRDLLDELIGVRRPELRDRLRDARGDGDNPADNPELMHALEDQMRLERRIAELEMRLARAEVVAGGVDADGGAALGARVRLRRLGATAPEMEYELVSSVEGDPSGGMLSVESPIGAELVGRIAGESFEVDAPGGPIRFEIVAVEDALEPDALAS
jgi:transcription elongation factor GreA